MKEQVRKAIKNSLRHHRSNLKKLKEARGKFDNDWGNCIITIDTVMAGRIVVSYSSDQCALCKLFQTDDSAWDCCSDSFGVCPLKLIGQECTNGSTVWGLIFDSRTRRAAIAGEEQMVETLKGLLVS